MCTCKKKNCGCNDTGLTTNNSCPPVCTNPNPCSEVFSTDCVIYDGPNVMLNPGGGFIPVLINGVSIAEAFQCILNYIGISEVNSGKVFLHTTLITSTTITITWNAIPAETSYQIFLSTNINVGSPTIVATISNNTYMITNLTPHTSYDIGVIGVGTGITSLVIRTQTI